MATEAQIAANRNNALSSGLFSRGDFVLPDEQAQYAEFCASFQAHLEPEGPIEQTLSAEIIHAAWRMRRCSAVAAGLTGSLDPMVDPAAAHTQQSVDRARNDAHRAFQRSLSELRRLQTERQFRIESFPEDFDPATLGVASFKDMAPALMIDTKRQLLLQKLHEILAAQSFGTVPTMVPNRARQEAATKSPGALIAEHNSDSNASFTIPTQSALGQTPRNSPCTCGSGMKFKRCCGKGAPAVLNLAA